MKIAIVGAGAMGSIYAGLMADAGNEVWAIDLWREHVQAMNARGLRVEGASGDRVVQVRATTDPAEVGAVDLVVLATKADGVASAAASMQPLLRPDTPIVTIQNGLGAAERIAQYLPPERILIGVAGGFGASMRGPGHVHHNGMQLIRLGEMHGGVTPRLQAVAKIWNDSGFNVKCFDDIQQLIWEKFICNVTFSGSCTVFDLPVGEVMANEQSWRVALGCGLEAYRAGVAKGVNFSFDDAATYIHDFGSKIPKALPSMLQDHRAARRSEIGAINGMVAVVAKEVGTEAPYNEVITAIVQAREARFP